MEEAQKEFYKKRIRNECSKEHNKKSKNPKKAKLKGKNTTNRDIPWF